jgi:DNA modification methylase
VSRTFLNGRVQLHAGDMLAVLPTLPECSVDSVCVDPPYHLTGISRPRADLDNYDNGKGNPYARRQAAMNGFMGKQWDGGDIAFRPETWAAVLRVLKPGGHMVAFAAPKNAHRMVCAIEDAGFEIRDTLMWLFGSGFNKVGMLKKKNPEIWCRCDGEQATEHDVRELQQANLSTAAANRYTGQNPLLHGLSEQSLQEHGTARSKSEVGWREQSGMEGRALYRAGEGLCDGAEPSAPEVESQRLRLRAHPDSGGDARQTFGSRRGSSSQESQQSGQQPRQFTGIRESSGTLDDRTLRDGGRCPRCGGISQAFDGFAGSLKPAYEPIALCRKPLSEPNVSANMLRWGCGALNIDSCRVEGRERTEYGLATATRSKGNTYGEPTASADFDSSKGRWPASILHDGSEEVVAAFPETGVSNGGGQKNGDKFGGGYAPVGQDSIGFGDSGSAARYFKSCEWTEEEQASRIHYTSKADSTDRAGSKHPTVKPISLVRYLAKLITPPGGTILDCFAGSGTLGEAAFYEGFSAILIERELEYVADIERRMELVLAGPDERARKSIKARLKDKPMDAGPLFDGAAA